MSHTPNPPRPDDFDEFEYRTESWAALAGMAALIVAALVFLLLLFSALPR